VAKTQDKNAQDVERAQAAFQKKEIQAREGKVAMAEYIAAGKAEREKTAKLRALRLAKEERERQEAVRTAEKKATVEALKAAAAAKAAAARPTAKPAPKPSSKSGAKPGAKPPAKAAPKPSGKLVVKPKKQAAKAKKKR
jgi:DNA transformation protein and related proteins